MTLIHSFACSKLVSGALPLHDGIVHYIPSLARQCREHGSEGGKCMKAVVEEKPGGKRRLKAQAAGSHI